MPILSKFTSKIDLVGKVGGALYGLHLAARTAGWTVGDVIGDMIESGINDIHFPNLSAVIADLTTGYGKEALKTLVMAALAGEVMDSMNFQKKYAGLLKKGAYNALIGLALGAVALRSTSWHSTVGTAGQFTRGNKAIVNKATNSGYGY